MRLRRVAGSLMLTALAFIAGVAVGGYLNIRPDPSRSLSLGSVDSGFLAHMAIHHDQAVTMAAIALQQGTGVVRSIAVSMMGSQLEEIGRMRGWLDMAGQPALPVSNSMNWMLVSRETEVLSYVAVCGASGMPGMATVDELNQLRGLKDEAFSIRFLQLMIRHHQGALPMARFAAGHAEHPQVRSLAARIAADQAPEIARMLQILVPHQVLPLPSPLGVAPLP